MTKLIAIILTILIFAICAGMFLYGVMLTIAVGLAMLPLAIGSVAVYTLIRWLD